MFTQNNMSAAHGLMEMASYQGRQIAVAAQSPLSELLASVPVHGDNVDGKELENISMRTNTAVGAHGEIEARLSKSMASIMGNIINKATNEVNPLIKEVLAKINERELQIKDKHVNGDTTVTQVTMPALFGNELFLELTRAYKGFRDTIPTGGDAESALYNDVVSSIFKELTREELASVTLTNNATLDSQVAALTGKEVNYYDVEYAVRTPQDANSPSLVVAYLILTGILNGRLEKADTLITEDIEREAITQYRARLGRVVMARISTIENALASDTIIAPNTLSVLADDARTNTIVVIGKTYRNWIKHLGGSPEAAIGFAKERRGNPMLGGKDLIKDPQKYLKIYEEDQRQRQSLVRIEMRNVVDATCSEVIGSYIAELEDSSSREPLQLLIADAVRAGYKETDKVEYVRKVVCDTVTEGDDVFGVLTEMDNVIKTMETPDRTHAIYMAVATLVGRWIAQQSIVIEL